MGVLYPSQVKNSYTMLSKVIIYEHGVSIILMLENSIDIGGGMMRQVWVTSPSLPTEGKDILALELQLQNKRFILFPA